MANQNEGFGSLCPRPKTEVLRSFKSSLQWGKWRRVLKLRHRENIVKSLIKGVSWAFFSTLSI